MKKTFPFSDPKHKPPRVVEAIKSEIRKYLKRERRKTLPEEVDFWDFDCRVGREAASAVSVHVAGLNPAIDNAVGEGWPAVYVEILAKPGHRTRKPASDRPADDNEVGEEA